MQEAGHEVHVLTRRLPDESSRERIREERLRVETVRPLPTLLEVYGNMKERIAGSDEPGGAHPSRADEGGVVEEASGGDRTSFPPAWKRVTLSLLGLPDAERGLVLPTLLRGLAPARSADLLYTTAPPRLTHVAGLALQRLTGLPWVAEFRDPWVVKGAPYREPAKRSAPADAIERRLEAACMARADLVVTVSRSHLELLRSRTGRGAPRRVELIRNGIPRPAAAARADGDRGRKLRRVVHLGKIYGRRDPGPLLRALASLRDRGVVSAETLRVDFVGADGHRYGPAVERMGIEDIIYFRDWVPHGEGQEILAGADLCLLLAQEQPLQVPNKLYEYLGLGRTILALADAHGESARMLSRVGGHYLVTEEDPPERVEEIVGAAVLGEEGHRLTARAADPEALLASWSTERQMERLMELLDEVTAPTGAG